MEKKLIYSPPVVCDISNLSARGAKKPLGTCSPGGGPNAHCISGIAVGDCFLGSSVTGGTGCHPGNDPLVDNTCQRGNGAISACTSGDTP
jgi:hypothetical protein